MMFSRRFVVCGVLMCAMILSGCAAEQPQSTVSRDLVSGVISSNGGGMAPANLGSIAATGVSGRTFDTGNMAFPDLLPQGDLVRTRTQ